MKYKKKVLAIAALIQVLNYNVKADENDSLTTNLSLNGSVTLNESTNGGNSNEIMQEEELVSLKQGEPKVPSKDLKVTGTISLGAVYGFDNYGVNDGFAPYIIGAEIKKDKGRRLDAVSALKFNLEKEFDFKGEIIKAVFNFKAKDFGGGPINAAAYVSTKWFNFGKTDSNFGIDAQALQICFIHPITPEFKYVIGIEQNLDNDIYHSTKTKKGLVSKNYLKNAVMVGKVSYSKKNAYELSLHAIGTVLTYSKINDNNVKYLPLFGLNFNSSIHLIAEKTKLTFGAKFINGLGGYAIDGGGLPDTVNKNVAEANQAQDFAAIKCAGVNFSFSNKWTQEFESELSVSGLYVLLSKNTKKEKIPGSDFIDGIMVSLTPFIYNVTKNVSINLGYNAALKNFIDTKLNGAMSQNVTANISFKF
jgi:hypothetical protein